MKCPFCQEEGKKSIVTPHGGTSTLLGFSTYYDEDGNYHSHDPNKLTKDYSCSNGHKWFETFKPECPNPACTYGSDTLTITKL